jgi:hypothetical protein
MKNFLAMILLAVGAAAGAQQLDGFTLSNVIDNKPVSLDTYPSCEGMLIVFTSNTCPYDEYYRNRLTQLAATYHDKVPVLLVNSSTDPGETNEKMLEKAKKLNLRIPYLSDKDQTLMTKLDARKSPEAFLLKNNNGKFSVVYRGAIDDNAQVEADVRQSYLRDAIDIMLSNQKIATPEMRPVGCNLKKKG